MVLSRRQTKTLLLGVFAAIMLTVISSCSENLASSGAQPNSTTPSHGVPRTLTVTGVGKVDIVPNHAILSVSTSCIAKTNSAAREECAIAMTAVFKELSETGIPATNIKTTNFRISEKTAWKDGKSERIGFEVTNSLLVRFDDFSIISGLIDRLVTVGGDALRINSFHYSADDLDEHELAAYKKAVEQAQIKAESLSRSSGVYLGDILTINTVGQTAAPSLRTGAAIMEAGDMGNVDTPLTPGVQTISKTVVIVWEIE